MTVRWGEKRYYSLDYYLKTTYGEKLYKISLDGGMTCTKPGWNTWNPRLHFLQSRRFR